ncbi:MAG: hypothetical protein WDM78_20550 [Puia sp.]
MTRILLIPALLFSSFIVNAQFKKNDILLGGQVSYTYYSTSITYSNVIYPPGDSKNSNGNFTISAGKALNESTVFGINLSYLPYSYINYPSLNGDILLKFRTDGYSAGIFYRKYKSLGKEFFIFGEASASYGWSNSSGKDSIGQELISGSTSIILANLYPGIAYRVSKHFFLELSIPSLINIGYAKSNNLSKEGSVSQTNKNEQFSISTSLSSNPFTALGIGFRLIL